MFTYLPLIGNLPLSGNSIHNYQESFDGRTVEHMRSIDIRTLQQTRAKAAPHVFRLPIVQKICYKVRATTLEHSVQCQRLIIPAGNASLSPYLLASTARHVSSVLNPRPISPHIPIANQATVLNPPPRNY